jgi:MPBQ/MSBQ methyltransferase
VLGCISLLLQSGDSPLQLGPKAEERGKVNGNPLSFLLRLLLGTAAGFYYFLVRIHRCICKEGLYLCDFL